MPNRIVKITNINKANFMYSVLFFGFMNAGKEKKEAQITNIAITIIKTILNQSTLPPLHNYTIFERSPYDKKKIVFAKTALAYYNVGIIKRTVRYTVPCITFGRILSE